MRQELGMTMAEFSYEIHVSPGNVGDWESEKRSSTPGTKALVAIAEAYNVSLDWLLLGKDGPFTKPSKEEMMIGEEEEKDVQLQKQQLNYSFETEHQITSLELDHLLSIARELSDTDIHLLSQLAARIKDLSASKH
nr:helix-turn-helix transcriptional regulator [Paenibacillus roseus]